jgi:pyruvate formate lyase activating enzyme
VVFLKVNFGGFVPLSTVDWRGRAVCTVFLRGCPVRCHYCQNAAILNGTDEREIGDVLAMIKESSLIVSGVVFSGGEATMQKEALLALAKGVKTMGLGVGLQTNGVYPDTIRALLEPGLVDKVSLDLKTQWRHYNNLLKKDFADRVRESLRLCTEAHHTGTLPEFEVVVTTFRGCEDDIAYIAKDAGSVDLVLQQGVLAGVAPLDFGELAAVADRLGRSVRIRTRQDGEVAYEGRRIVRAESIDVSAIEQERRSER